MYKMTIALLLVAAGAMAQTAQPAGQAPQKFSSNLVVKHPGPTYSDINCAGFVTPDTVSTKNFVVASEYSPNASRFATGDTIFLTGPGITVGKQYRVVRRVADPNHTEIFPGQQTMLKKMGKMYADLGIVEVKYVTTDVATAKIEFSCQPITPGDLIIPFVPRPQLTYVQSAKPLEKFGQPTSSVTGKIVMSKDFDSLLGTGAKVYVNLGSNNGLKPGEYLRVTRGYGPSEEAPIDRLSERASVWEDTSQKMPTITSKAMQYMPRRNIGEIMILSVTPTTATGIIARALQEIHLGDQVEVPEAQATADAQ